MAGNLEEEARMFQQKKFRKFNATEKNIVRGYARAALTGRMANANTQGGAHYLDEIMSQAWDLGLTMFEKEKELFELPRVPIPPETQESQQSSQEEDAVFTSTRASTDSAKETESTTK